MLKETEFYCVQCRNQVKLPKNNIYFGNDRNGRPRLVGEDRYGHSVFKYVKYSQADRLEQKYS